MSDLSPETLALLEAQRHAPGLSEAKRAALKSGVLGHIASGTAPLAAAAAGKGTLAFVGIASLALAVAGGGAAWWAHASKAGPIAAQATSGALAPPASPDVAPSGAPSLAPPQALAEPPPQALAEPPSSAAPEAPEPSLVATSPTQPHVARTKPVTSPPSAKLGRPAAGSTDPAMPPVAPVVAAPAAPSSVTPGEPTRATTANASALEEETRLVRGAASARKEGDASRALALLDAHASRFPHGVLERERRAERVFALCDAHRTVEARAEAASLLRDGPRGALANRVRASCGGP